MRHCFARERQVDCNLLIIEPKSLIFKKCCGVGHKNISGGLEVHGMVK